MSNMIPSSLRTLGGSSAGMGLFRGANLFVIVVIVDCLVISELRIGRYKLVALLLSLLRTSRREKLRFMEKTRGIGKKSSIIKRTRL